MKLFVNNEFIKDGSLKELLKLRNKIIKEKLTELEENEECDKYAFNDWLFNLSKNKEKLFYLDEGEGFQFEIVG